MQDKKGPLRSMADEDARNIRLARQRDERKPVVAKDSLSTPRMRDFAERLIACETKAKNASRTTVLAAVPVCEKLRPHLANLMGNTGYRALLLRALARAEAELPSLRTMQVQEDGSLAALDKAEMQTDPEQFAKGSVVLVAQLLGLLMSFIGEKLTLQIVRDVWPKLVPNDLDSSERKTT